MASKITVRMGANGPVILPQAIDGLRCITGTVEVENTRFIRGRVRAGDLVVVQPALPPRSLKKED